jgi:hypothetical protein
VLLFPGLNPERSGPNEPPIDSPTAFGKSPYLLTSAWPHAILLVFQIRIWARADSRAALPGSPGTEMIYNQDLTTPLINYVKELEGHSSLERGRKLQSILEASELKPIIQEHRRPRIQNFILDFAPDSEEKCLLFSAHYDAVKDKPAANDNASGVAVLLGLCQILRNRVAPVRVVFFDREEAWFKTPWLRLGLLGSLYYVLKTDLRDILAVYNLEFCGNGDRLVIWPIRNGQKNLPASRRVAEAAAHLNLDYYWSHFPWLFISSDHLSFRLKGKANAVTLSLLPAGEAPILETFISKLNLATLLAGRRPVAPGILSVIHGADDRSDNLKEESLQLMLSLLVQIINDHS